MTHKVTIGEKEMQDSIGIIYIYMLVLYTIYPYCVFDIMHTV